MWLQLTDLVLSVLVNTFTNQEKITFNSFKFFVYRCLELFKNILNTKIWWALFLETVWERDNLFFYAFKEVIGNEDATGMFKFENV